MAMTMAEKLLSRKNKTGEPVKAGSIIDARIDRVMLNSSFARIYDTLVGSGMQGGIPSVWDRNKVYLFLDHFQPPPTLEVARDNRISRNEARRLNLRYFYDTVCGISHQQMFDFGYVRPGELIVGTDSHSTIYGALNAGGTGIGQTDAAYALTFGELWFQVPGSIKIVLNGGGRSYPFAKDVALYLAGEYGDDFAQYRSLEFAGSVANSMDISERMCLAAHATELGAKFSFFNADPVVIESNTKRNSCPFQILEPDSGASYERIIEVDVDSLDFYVAKPHHFGNVVSVGDIAGTRIDQAVVGGCSNGRLADIQAVASIVRGKKIAPHTRFLVSPASWEVYRQCMSAGLIPTLLDAGIQFLEPGCGVCQPMKGCLDEGEVAITSTTRNYKGRLGSPKAFVYLAGPVTVAVSALAGEISDPNETLKKDLLDEV